MQAAIAFAKSPYPKSVKIENAYTLQRLLLVTAFLNLFIVALLGVVLRSYPFFSSAIIEYKNLLHGHSHFAFGGWVMPAILALLLRCFPELEKAVAFKHWRNIAILLLFSAYGMLVAFPLQGYKALSVSFSTVSVLAGFYLAIVTWKAVPKIKSSLPLSFLTSALFYLVISAAGPFATGPLIAMGKAGTTIYFDAIYFYLHFQYNGWFAFAVLAFLYQYLQQNKEKTNGRKVLYLLNFACVPSFFLSTLWHHPGLVFNIVGGIAAALQCIAVIFLLLDIRNVSFGNRLVKTIVHFSFVALLVKVILQFLSAFPSVAVLAYEHRNFIIAYLHLVLLGFISLFLIGWGIKHFGVHINASLKTGLVLFLSAFVFSELLLLISPFGFITGYQYNLSLLLVSTLLPAGVLLILKQVLFGYSQVKPKPILQQ